MPARRKGVIADATVGRAGRFRITTPQWDGLAALLPMVPALRPNGVVTVLQPVDVRREVESVCTHLLLQKAMLCVDADLALLAGGGKSKKTPLQDLEEGLAQVAAAWRLLESADGNGQIGATHRLGIESVLTKIIRSGSVNTSIRGMGGIFQRMAGASRRAVEDLKKATGDIHDTSWPDFVRRLSAVLEGVGVECGATGRLYDEGGEPAHFQRFVVALNKLLPDGVREHSGDQAVAAAVAKALRGVERRSGKSLP